MTQRDVMGICLIVLVILSNIWIVGENTELRETVDNQKIVMYNKDTQIEAKNIKIEELNTEVRKLKIALEEKEVSRGSARTIVCETSAYSCGDGMTSSYIMANGEEAHVGAVACNFLPIGTRVRIDGNIYTVKDRCGIDDCIDIYMDTAEECYAWGRRTKEVEIY